MDLHTFSDASMKLEEVFIKSSLDEKEKETLKKDIYLDVEKFFHSFNAIASSNIGHKDKLRMLNDYRNYADLYFEANGKNKVYTSLEVSMDFFNFYQDILSYIFNIIDTKFKRAVKEVERQEG